MIRRSVQAGSAQMYDMAWSAAVRVDLTVYPAGSIFPRVTSGYASHEELRRLGSAYIDGFLVRRLKVSMERDLRYIAWMKREVPATDLCLPRWDKPRRGQKLSNRVRRAAQRKRQDQIGSLIYMSDVEHDRFDAEAHLG